MNMDSTKKLKADGVYIDDADGGALVATLHVESQETGQREGTSQEMSADLASAYAAEMVRRWNSHDALVEALKGVMAELNEYGFIGKEGVDPDDEDFGWKWSPSIQIAREALKAAKA